MRPGPLPTRPLRPLHGEILRTVPGIRLDLYNEKKEVIQSETAPAPAGLL